MQLSDFDYYLPKQFIAQTPVEPRDSSKLMILDDKIEHKRFYNLPEYLERGDAVVLNDSKVVPARIIGRKETGGKIEVLIIKRINEDYECLIKGRIKPGMKILFGDETSGMAVRRTNHGFIMAFNKEPNLQGIGEMPTPPYIKEKLLDQKRYNTVYAENNGSIAAPTAGLHFTKGLIKKLEDKGVNTAYITLHVGAGTFLPIQQEKIETHKMEEEYLKINKENAEIINNASRVFAVGTTVVRALESSCKNDKIIPNEGWTDLFIYPGYRFKSKINCLLTNFHLPRSTLLLLVCAFAGKEKIFRAYKNAMENNYRFYSFGDAMMIKR
ncbi:MAG: tRNA preQ1(34) S-adenosylmethionine ribosyltransferase-isomerase QueA [Thermoplasmatales archaeon]|nr:tRNA preQ1(34) S-adenosylmethionine ribosyltransferase-isomerase QueA [Thermoplasmatales archaeon]